MEFKKYIIFLLATSFMAACSPVAVKVTVSNPSLFDRSDELVEIPVPALAAVSPGPGQSYVVKDDGGTVIPSQVTHDGFLLFRPGLGAGDMATFTVSAGKPPHFEPLTYGRYVPERKDDFVWENDRIAMRAYGPALVASDGPSNGFDFWYKRTGRLVTDGWYADDIAGMRSYHDDHGEGLDDYKVGRSLGGGAMAPVFDGVLVLNGNYVSQEVLDNGPLRTTFRLVYDDIEVDGKAFRESRTISIDAGSQMSRVVQEYGFDTPVTVAAGFPLHREGMGEGDYEGAPGWLLLSEPATDKSEGVYLGLVFPGGIGNIRRDSYEVPRGMKNAGIYEHILAEAIYEPGQPFTYYTGYGWTGYGFDGRDGFREYLERFSIAVRTPFEVSYE